MAVRVVHRLEVVEVDHEDRQRERVAGGVRHLRGQRLVGGAAVRQPGEQVRAADPLELDVARLELVGQTLDAQRAALAAVAAAAA